MKTKLLLMLIALTFAYPIFGQSGTTKRVAILETVDEEGKVSYGVKLMVRSKLAYAITNTPGYEGYDRVDVGSILDEHEFQRTGLVSDKDIKRLGEMTGADYILVAEVAYLNDSYIVLSAKILNVETTRVEQTADTQTQATVEDLEQNCKLLAGKLLNVNTGELIINGRYRYVGEHKNGKPHGKGIIFYNSTYLKSYEGDWYYGKRHGKGILIWQDGGRYEGEWKNDEQHGTGTKISAYGFKYVGEWKYGDHDGLGTIYYNNGARFEGGWLNGRKSGSGTFYEADGSYEKRNYINDKKDGKQEKYDKNGKLISTSIYENGKQISKSTYENGKLKLISKSTYENGKLISTFTYNKNGKLINKKFYD